MAESKMHQLHTGGEGVLRVVLLFLKLGLILYTLYYCHCLLSYRDNNWSESLHYTNCLPSSFSDSLLNLNPLGSLPTKW